jgi:hypothetical protein
MRHAAEPLAAAGEVLEEDKTGGVEKWTLMT